MNTLFRLAHLAVNNSGSTENALAFSNIGDTPPPNVQNVINITSPYAQPHMNTVPNSVNWSSDDSNDYHFSNYFENSFNENRHLPSSSTFYESDEEHAQHFDNPENVFNTSFMKTVVSYFAQENAHEFSITEYLPENAIDSVEKSCDCCLCKLSKGQGDVEYCIQRHPEKKLCNNELDMHVQTVCDNCLDAMILNCEKNRAKMYKCTMNQCSQELRTLSALRNHLLKHFNVKNFVCCVCEKGYCSRISLCRHQRIHLRRSRTNSANE